MNDPLSNFLRKTGHAVESAVPPKQVEEYSAFDTKDHVVCLQILRARQQPGHMPPYNILLNVTFSGKGITHVVLVYTFMMIFIKGKNLQPLVMAFKLRTVDVIQEFDPAKWSKPTDPNATIIESIEVKSGEKGPGIPEAERWCGLDLGQVVH